MFMICEAYDSRDAVGGSHVVDNAELFDAEHPLATLHQLIERGAPHAAKSYTMGIVLPCFGHRGVSRALSAMRWRCTPYFRRRSSRTLGSTFEDAAGVETAVHRQRHAVDVAGLRQRR